MARFVDTDVPNAPDNNSVLTERQYGFLGLSTSQMRYCRCAMGTQRGVPPQAREPRAHGTRVLDDVALPR